MAFGTAEFRQFLRRQGVAQYPLNAAPPHHAGHADYHIPGLIFPVQQGPHGQYGMLVGLNGPDDAEDTGRNAVVGIALAPENLEARLQHLVMDLFPIHRGNGIVLAIGVQIQAAHIANAPGDKAGGAVFPQHIAEDIFRVDAHMVAEDAQKTGGIDHRPGADDPLPGPAAVAHRHPGQHIHRVGDHD